MRRGIPTLLAIFLLVALLGLFGWWLTRSNSSDPSQLANDPSQLAARPIPPAGWGPIRVITANIRLDDPKDGPNTWLRRRDLLLKTLLRYMPDILGCQELSPAQGAYLRRELATWYAYYPRAGIGAGRAPASGTATGTGSASADTRAPGGAAGELLGALSDSLASLNTLFYRADRFEILDGECGLVLPNELQADATENTFFTLAVLQERRAAGATAGNPGTVIVVDVHFRHNEAFAIKCAAKLRERIAAWQERYPQSGVIVLGDINRDRTTKLYEALTARGPLVLVDTFDYLKIPTGKNGTYHAFTGQPNGAWPTDLIFSGGGLKAATAADILRDKSADGRYPTDHFLVEAGVCW